MSHNAVPFERQYNLGSLGRAGAELKLSARDEELVKLAQWAGVRRVESFSASVTLQRLSTESFVYEADLRAEIIQDCVVSLEPVRSAVRRNLHRELHLAETLRAPVDGDVVVDPTSEDDDVREEIASLRYDLAGPLLEEFVLAIDPYPRAQGVVFVVPAKPELGRTNPFAVLKNLKKQG
jgi:hypothetical protein